MANTFKDHFSNVSSSYKAHRPTYPKSLFSFLANTVTHRDVAWDCATGNGQAAEELATYFDRVIATDASASQIEQARLKSNIEYKVLPAEKTDFAVDTFDLVSVAQALHWFKIDDFFQEAVRVLKPGGVLAVWSYNMASVSPEIDAVLHPFVYQFVGPYWPPERKMVDRDYRDITFPLPLEQTPSFEMEKQWTKDDMIAYAGTWSAVNRYRARHEEDPVLQLSKGLDDVWGKETLRVVWPVNLFVGRKEWLTSI